jgi:hypothetical protein
MYSNDRGIGGGDDRRGIGGGNDPRRDERRSIGASDDARRDDRRSIGGGNDGRGIGGSVDDHHLDSRLRHIDDSRTVERARRAADESHTLNARADFGNFGTGNPNKNASDGYDYDGYINGDGSWGGNDSVWSDSY